MRGFIRNYWQNTLLTVMLLALFSAPLWGQTVSENFGIYARALRGQLPGITTNTDAAAGNIGEYAEASLANGSAISLTTNTDTNVISVSLTSGDWDVYGVIGFSPGGATVTTVTVGGINTTTSALPGVDSGQQSGVSYGAGITGGGSNYLTTPMTRIKINSTTTVYLVSRATFTTSTMNVWGTIKARRTH